jgi:oligopeptide transport system substrate-binding protein
MMKQPFYILIAIALLLSSCATDDPAIPSTGREAKGPAAYGGAFDISQSEPYQTLFPVSILDIGSSNIASQMYEGLVKFDPRDMSVKPSLAESHEIDTSGTIYTFTLKKGVFFHDSKCFADGTGREMKAADVKYSFELLCTNDGQNVNFANAFKDKVVGANEFYNGSASSVSGIEILDDYTVQITLLQPRTSFLYILGSPITSIIPKEAVDNYGNTAKVGTGPFVYSEAGDKDTRLVLKRNGNYHRSDSLGNRLPYLDSVVFHVVNTKSKQLDMFRDGSLDIINGLPSEKIKEVVQEQIADFANVPPKFILGRSPEMITQYYEFNLTKPIFQDVRVRKAFNYAIDRQKIYRDVLVEEAYGPGKNGLTPPSFRDYDIEKVTGYSFDGDKARSLLADAGFPDGRGFPNITVQLNSGGTRNSRVGFEIQKQLFDVLNINVEMNVVPFAQKINDSKYGRVDISRSAWVADYPSPETFLYICYGKNIPESLEEPSFPNTMRYKNPEFDALYEQAVTNMDKEESYELFMQAEQIMMDDAPLIVLWYSENYRLLQSYIRNFYSNAMNYLDCTEVYVKAREGKVKSDG